MSFIEEEYLQKHHWPIASHWKHLPMFMLYRVHLVTVGSETLIY